MKKNRWSNDDVETWAESYVSFEMSLMTLERKIHVSHATIHWCFIHRLPRINGTLYEKVLGVIRKHKKKI